MIIKESAFLLILLGCIPFLTFCSNAKPEIEEEQDERKTEEKQEEVEELISKLGATKYISNCDFDANNKFKPFQLVESIGASIELMIDNEVKHQGEGSYRLEYNFTGKNVRGGAQRVAIRQTWYDDYRSDLSFHPLGISLWLKSQKGNTNAITIKLYSKMRTSPLLMPN